MPTGLVSGEASLLGLQTIAFSLYPQPFLCACTFLVSLPLLTKTPVLLDEGSTLMINFNYLLKCPISKYRHMGFRASMCEFGGVTQFSPQQIPFSNIDNFGYLFIFKHEALKALCGMKRPVE